MGLKSEQCLGKEDYAELAEKKNESEFDTHKDHIEGFLNELRLEKTMKMIEDEFGRVMSRERRQLIQECLRLRQRRMAKAIEN